MLLLGECMVSVSEISVTDLYPIRLEEANNLNADTPSVYTKLEFHPFTTESILTQYNTTTGYLLQ